jgi:hypothetical protein
MVFLPYSQEYEKIILGNLEKKLEQEYFLKVIKLFSEHGLTIKVRYMFPKKPIAFYRTFCFI